jgi:hypothetical protein
LASKPTIEQKILVYYFCEAARRGGTARVESEKVLSQLYLKVVRELVGDPGSTPNISVDEGKALIDFIKTQFLFGVFLRHCPSK